MFKKLRITCDQATTICDKSQYGKASISEILKLQIHFLKCKVCALYSKQNTFLSKIYKTRAVDCKQYQQCLSAEQKVDLKKQLEGKNK
jgi:hypothetical protein